MLFSIVNDLGNQKNWGFESEIVCLAVATHLLARPRHKSTALRFASRTQEKKTPHTHCGAFGVLQVEFERYGSGSLATKCHDKHHCTQSKEGVVRGLGDGVDFDIIH